MNKQHPPTSNNANNGRMWAGIMILGIGVILLAGKLGVDWLFPRWIFNWNNFWPTILIVVGLIIGGNSNFRNPVAVFLICFGGFFLLKHIFGFNIGPFIGPAIIIGIGLWLLLGKGRDTSCPPRPSGSRASSGLHGQQQPHHFEWDKRVADETGNPAPDGDTAFEGTAGQSAYENNVNSEDYVKTTALFSEVKKTVISKRFQGGEIVNIFGGTNINLIQADIQHPVVITVFQLFAGMKIIVPPHWKIQSDMVSVFGEVDDRRFTHGIPQDDQKIVHIKGTSIFGGVTIKNL